MDLTLNKSLGRQYKSNSQKIRVISEDWVMHNIYCLSCGENNLCEFTNNMPAADFYCQKCSEEYELKSKNAQNAGRKILDGAYSTMIERINSANNPSFFFLTYNKSEWKVNNFILIPKHFFIPDIIEKRKPLSKNARRSGWTGCNIILNNIPQNGKIHLVENSKVSPKEIMLKKWKATQFLRSENTGNKTWVIDIMKCLDQVEKEIFQLKDFYRFEKILKQKHPKNNYIRAKIRQQLQILRDREIIEFKGNGTYKKNIS